MGGVSSTLASYTATPCLIDRRSGDKVKEVMPLPGALREWVLYQTFLGNLLLKLPVTWWVLSWQHNRVAAHADSPRSKKDIPSFIKTYQVDASAAEKPMEEYATLQEFFTRRLKPELRPISGLENGSIAVNPADSRLVVFDNVEAAHRFWIKSQHFDVMRLMGPSYDTQDHWKRAAIAINRLAPMDHHRLHASVTGRVVKIKRHGHNRMDIMTENDRLVMELDSREFGTVVQVMIGASEVGTVVPLVKEGQEVTKGDEVAMFAYGGSIMTTLFGHGAITFDADLEANSKRGCETLVTYGSSLGRSTGHPHAHSPAGP